MKPVGGYRERSFPRSMAAARDVAVGAAAGDRAGDGDPSPYRASPYSRLRRLSAAGGGAGPAGALFLPAGPPSPTLVRRARRLLALRRQVHRLRVTAVR